MLPIVALDTGTVDIGGTPVPIRSLSRDEVVALSALGDDPGAAEVFVISRGCSIPEDEAREWRTKVSAATASSLLSAISELSGLQSGKR